MRDSLPVPDEILRDLKEVTLLLLRPNAAVMRTCERKLQCAVDRLRTAGLPAADLQKAKPLIRNIRFLLEGANRFWQSRQSSLAPALQYSAEGWLYPSSASSSFTIEV